MYKHRGDTQMKTKLEKTEYQVLLIKNKNTVKTVYSIKIFELDADRVISYKPTNRSNWGSINMKINRKTEIKRYRRMLASAVISKQLGLIVHFKNILKELEGYY